MKDYKFEVCANGVASCIAAQEGGADRVELCAGIPEGGTTPSVGCIRLARKKLDIGLNVIIRSRGGDFLYTEDDIREMIEDIHVAKGEGADGLVFGCLNAEGNIDLSSMEKLMQAAGDTPVTFHRAFDCCKDPFKALHQIEELGCVRILTSGQQPTAEKGISLLKQLQQEANLIIMAGCGVNENNIARIAHETGVREFHFSAREAFPSLMQYRNPDVYMGDPDAEEDTIMVTSSAKVKATIEKAFSFP